MALKIHPSRKAVEGPSSTLSLASSPAAVDLPNLPREDTVLLAGDDDRDVVGLADSSPKCDTHVRRIREPLSMACVAPATCRSACRPAETG